MYKFFILLTLLLAVIFARAQNRAAIKGKVIDSLNTSPVEFATVAVLDSRDTSNALLAYTLTDKTGNFALHNLPPGIPLKVLISFVSYRSYRKIFTLNKGETHDLGTVLVQPRQLKEVTVKGERMAVTIRKDTIEFDAEAFKTRPNAVVEDLLKKLPGIEIDNDGTITVMGKSVSKIMVDGHEFFINDPRIATKNLDADLISKVQVYDDREDDPDHLIPEVNVKKIINLKFKKTLKKSTFGKAYAGVGTQDHYQAGAIISTFRDTLQVSLLANTNNLNNTGFDFNDLYTTGGVGRGGAAFGRGGFFSTQAGKQTATSTGININTDYGEKLKINFAYYLKHANTEVNSLTNRQQLLGDTTATTHTLSSGVNNDYTHTFTGLIRWQPDPADQLKYEPSLNITRNGAVNGNNSNSFSNFVDPINMENSTSNSVGSPLSFQHDFNYHHQFKKKGESVDISQNFHFTPGNSSTVFSEDALTSYLPVFPSYVLNREGENIGKATDAGLNVAYRYPVSKQLTADVSVNAGYTYELNRALTYNFDPRTGLYDSLLVIESSDLTRSKWQQSVIPGFTYNFRKNISLVAHLGMLWQQVNNSFGRNTAAIYRNYFNFLPNVSLNLQSFSISYNRSVQLPNISDMIPYSVVFSPLYSVTGNPDLKAATRDNINLGFSKYDFQNGMMYNISAGASFEQNGVFRARTVNMELAETSTPINKNGRQSYTLGGFINKRFKKKHDLQLSMSTNAGVNANRDFFVLNEQNGYQYNYGLNITQRFSLNWKDIVLLDPEYTISDTRTNYSGVDYASQNYIRHNFYTHFNFFFLQHMNIDGSYTYTYNPLVPAGFQKGTNLLNISIARQFLAKDRAEIKLSCYDLLNQAVAISRTINQNTITDVQSQIIKRYLLLTLQYKFNKSTVKK